MALETSPESPAAVRTISRILADWIGRLGAVWIDGQVAEYRPRPGAKLHYFVLRDTDVDMSLNVKVAAGVLGRLDPPLAEGQRVVVHARPDFYPGRGSLSMLAKEIRPVGIGALLAELARLREVLAAEGLFAPERKKPLPFIPTRIGLICGRASAAMEDVLANARERWPSIAFEIREVPVQGVQAVAAVTAALADLDANPEVDVIIVTRGGGSVEDLLPFSNEAMVRAVAACRTPVVSAIGHEQDAPLLDFVADLRASTPTDAAKRVVPSLREQVALVDGPPTTRHRRHAAPRRSRAADPRPSPPAVPDRAPVPARRRCLRRHPPVGAGPVPLPRRDPRARIRHRHRRRRLDRARCRLRAGGRSPRHPGRPRPPARHALG